MNPENIHNFNYYSYTNRQHIINKKPKFYVKNY
jgi:hypothetical protein